MDSLKQQLDVLDFKYPLSTKTIRKKIKTDEKLINKNFLIKTLYKLPEYNLVEPYKIGSNKNKLSVWTRV